MKKIILAVIITICSLTANGQIDNTPLYSNYYMYPECFESINPTTFYNRGFPGSGRLKEIAQPYLTDTVVAVRGVASCSKVVPSIFLPLPIGCDSLYYFQIVKGLNANVIVSTGYEMMSSGELHYFEVLFDNPVFLHDTFYVIQTFPGTPFIWGGDGQNCTENCYILTARPSNDKTCCATLEPMLRTYYTNSTWEPVATTTYNTNWTNPFAGCPPSLYLFPILDTIPVFSRITTTITNDSTNGTFVCITDIDTSNALTLPYEAGFIYSTDTTGGLTLNNPNVNIINYLYDTTTNTFNELINYNNFPCNEPVYYRSFLTTTIETWYDTMTQTNYGETETFSYNIDITQPTNLTIVEDTEVSLTLSWTGDARSYQIIRNNQHLAYIDTNVYVDTNIVFGETYTYQIKGISYQCQSDVSNPVSYTTTNDLNNILNENNIKLYPNPTDKELTVETTIPIQKIEIINANGQTIYTIEPNKKEIKINTSKFVTGNYIAVITTSKAVFKRQFVVR